MISYEITSFWLRLNIRSSDAVRTTAGIIVSHFAAALFNFVQDLDIATPEIYGRDTNYAALSPTANSDRLAILPGLKHPEGTSFFSVISSQHDTTFAFVGPRQLATLVAASALLPNESMLKSATAPKAAAAVNVWVLLILLIVSLLGFAIMVDRWPKYGENCLISA